MIEISAVFDAYINANILLIVAYLGWLAVAYGLDRAGLGGAHTTRPWTAERSVPCSLVCPPGRRGLRADPARRGHFRRASHCRFRTSWVARYLSGGFDMKPTEFESVMDFRAELSAQILSMSSVTGMIIASGLIAGFAWCSARLALNIHALRSIIRDSPPLAAVWVGRTAPVGPRFDPVFHQGIAAALCGDPFSNAGG